MKNYVSLAVLVGMLSIGAAQAETLTYSDLISRLTDLSRLAILPGVGEKTAQWSSYDRASRYDAGSGKYEGWDANGDGSGIIRKEGDSLVLAEMEGPGCIWRIWSAEPQKGHVKIYLDGAETPVIDLPFRAYFDRTSPPFTRPALVHTVARGWNNYTPIPYAKSCKIVAEPGWGQYYQFVYQTFAKGTQVQTFKSNLTTEENWLLDRANETLLQGNEEARDEGQEVVQGRVAVRPGKSVTVAQLEGSRAITAFRIRLRLPSAPADRQVLRELTVQMRWDGEKEPAVWSPLGDFFGSTTGHTYRSLPLGRTGDEWWYCRWYMPFERSATIEIGNDGQEVREISYEIEHAPLKASLEGTKFARFHAKWHRDAFLPAEPERKIDWTLLTTKGSGRFAGVMLHIWNPRGSWWGEGDEKFHVDGEKFPSTLGTGSEDYFGYAWCDPQLFENAYHNQTQNDGNNKGHITVNRWHVADSIPFHTAFEGFMEKYYSNSRPTLYASTVYWYLAPGGEDPYKPVPVSERAGYWKPLPVMKTPGVLEGEQMKVLSVTAGSASEQDLSGFGDSWSNDAQLWWTGAKPGDVLKLAMPVEKAGSYRVVAQLTQAPDYGIAQISLDGKKVGEPRDMYQASVVPSGPIDLGTHDLTVGTHELQVEITGANEKAVKSYMFGLDYLKLESR